MYTYELTTPFTHLSFEQLRDFCFDPWTFPRIFPEPLTAIGNIDLDRIKIEVGKEFSFIHWSFGFIPLRWTVRIAEVGSHHFIDEMVHGPFRSFRHEHIISLAEDGPLYTDRLTYDPIGGSLSDRILVKRYLNKIFQQRHLLMKQLTKKGPIQ